MTDNKLKELVLTLEEKVWEAVIEHDGSALGDLFTDNYIEITVDGKRIEKSEIVERRSTNSTVSSRVSTVIVKRPQAVAKGSTRAE